MAVVNSVSSSRPDHTENNNNNNSEDRKPMTGAAPRMLGQPQKTQSQPYLPPATTTSQQSSSKRTTIAARPSPPASGRGRRTTTAVAATTTTMTGKNIALFVVLVLLAVQLFIFPFTAHHAIETLSNNAALLTTEWTTQGMPSSSLSSTSAAQQKKKKKRRGLAERTPDGSFNGGPMYYKTAKMRNMDTKVHCVGETYTAEAWKFRSCRFAQLFCYNVTAHDFVVFATPDEQRKGMLYAQREYLHVSDSLYRRNGTNAVSLGGLNLKWGQDGMNRLKWFPRIIAWSEQEADDTIGYYELPESTVLMPYHSLNGANPGHLVWDDFLSLYNLLRMFFIEPDEHYLLPLRYVLQDGERGLWASCDLRPEKKDLCHHMITKFWPLMVGHDTLYHFSSTMDATLIETTYPAGTSSLICAKSGLAGIGPLTDHGLFKAHGWEQSDYRTMHNIGRGPLLYEFRNFMLRNLNIAPERALLQQQQPQTSPHQPKRRPFRVVFSQKSSDIPMRSIAFDKQIAFVKERLPNVQVEAYILKDLSVYEQMDIAAQTAVFVSLCGGGAVTAMFLPKGASVMVYYAEHGGTNNGKRDMNPALLDWDVLNSMSHLRVHWVPRNTRDTELDLQILVMMIRNELTLIEQHQHLS